MTSSDFGDSVRVVWRPCSQPSLQHEHHSCPS